MAVRRREIRGSYRRGGCATVLLIVFGLLMFPAGVYLTWQAETQLTDHAADFARVAMLPSESARAVEGRLVKMQGQPEGEFLVIDEWEGEAIYFHRLVEVLEQDTSGGYDEGPSSSWHTVTSDLHWVESFTIDGIEIQPADAYPVGREVVHSVYRKTGERGYSPVTGRVSPSIGDGRINIEILDARKPVIVLGEMSDGVIAGGSRFVVSTQDEEQTLQTLKSEYGREKWRIRGFAAFFLFMGLLWVFSGLQMAFGAVPIIGGGVTWALAAAILLFTVLWVMVAGLSMAAFWVFAGLVALTLAYFAYRGVTTAKPDAPADATDEAVCRAVPPPQPDAAAGGNSCANCGAEFAPEHTFYSGCGSRVD